MDVICKCGQSSWSRFGFTRNGAQRFKCKSCGKTKLKDRVSQRGRNGRTDKQVSEVKSLLLEGYTSRQVSAICNLHRNTVMSIGHDLPQDSRCPCGLALFHRHECSVRFKRHPVRQRVMDMLHGKPTELKELTPAMVEDIFWTLWTRMPQECRDLAFSMAISDSYFWKHIPINKKLAMLECGQSWCERWLYSQATKEERMENRKWLKQAKGSLAEVKHWLKENRRSPWQSPQKASRPDKTSQT